MSPRALTLCLLCVGCAAPAEQPAATPTRPAAEASMLLRGARLATGEIINIRVADNVITHATSGAVPATARERDLRGALVVPGVIDSHVHLTFLPVGGELRAAGVASVVDLGAPLGTLALESPLPSISSGPMLTCRGGYPTRGWGHDGYGLEVDGAADAAAAVTRLAEAGAGVVKVALAGDRGLDARSLEAAVQTAHARDLLVVAHALSADDVRLAASGGVDILAHAPVEPLDDATVRAWSGRAVITTLSAFSPDAASTNLRRLIEAGAVPIYGTDLGNTRVPGISAAEIAAMSAAGMSGADILESMTSAPARLWKLDAGAIEPGRRACILILDASPMEAPASLASPREVIGC